MVDEVRIIDCSNGDSVLIGMGSMGWSGGMYNGSRKSDYEFLRIFLLLHSSRFFVAFVQAFCLYRPVDTPIFVDSISKAKSH